MYNLPYHKEKNPQVIQEFIDQYPFAFVSGCDFQNKPVATQVPVFIEEQNGKKVLRGHIMKNTDHHKAFVHNENVLVVFTGRHTYVSGTWYSNPYSPSTWNFMSVHIQGKIRFLEENALKQILQKTTLHFESNNQQSTTVFDNLPKDYTRRLMRAIVGFEIEIVEMDHVFKLSQDRDYESYLHIIQKLEQQDLDGQIIAAEMKKRTKEVFPNQSPKK